LVIVAISLITYGPETRDSFIYINDVVIVRVEEFSLVLISVENALYLKNGLY